MSFKCHRKPNHTFGQSKQNPFDMNRLLRNLFFSVRNSPNQFRSTVNCVHRRTIVNSACVSLFEKSPGKTSWITNSLFATRKVQFSSDAVAISQLDYERFCAETLDALCDYFEELVESVNHLAAADIVNKVNLQFNFSFKY